MLLCGFSNPALALPTVVFASTLPVQYLVDRIGGKRIDSKVMVKPGHSPATFEPSPKQMAALSEAQLFIRIGVPFEKSWIKKISSINPEIDIVDARYRPETTEVGAAAEQIDDHKHDTHVWTDPLACIELSETITQALIKHDPEGAAIYWQNLRDLTHEFIGLDATLREKLSGLAQRKFMVFHPAWGHFAQRYGLTQIAIEHEGKSPGSQSLNKMIESARKEEIQKILVQPQFDKKQARTIATAINARLIEVDPLAYNIPESLTAMADALASP